jgi:hypothetical protein
VDDEIAGLNPDPQTDGEEVPRKNYISEGYSTATNKQAVKTSALR